MPAAGRVPAPLGELRRARAPVRSSRCEPGASFRNGGSRFRYARSPSRLCAPLVRRTRVALPHRGGGAPGGGAGRDLLGRRRLHRPQFHDIHHWERWTAGRSDRRLQLSPGATGTPDPTPTGEPSMKLTFFLTILLT